MLNKWLKTIVDVGVVCLLALGLTSCGGGGSYSGSSGGSSGSSGAAPTGNFAGQVDPVQATD